MRLPEGYILRDDNLVLVSECTDAEVRSEEDESSDMWLDLPVRYAYRAEDKANTLLYGEVMQSVSQLNSILWEYLMTVR